jgi:hypothetical protein
MILLPYFLMAVVDPPVRGGGKHISHHRIIEDK